jgi:hypothetical protein
VIAVVCAWEIGVDRMPRQRAVEKTTGARREGRLIGVFMGFFVVGWD